MIKRLARELLRDHPDLFTEDFNMNKQVVGKITSYKSKRLRNQVAGYITSLVKLSKKKQKIMEENTGTAQQQWAGRNTLNIKIKLLAALKYRANGSEAIEINANSWKDALKKLVNEYPDLSIAIDHDGNPKPGFVVFVDGVDYRIKEDEEEANEIYILPVNHGGIEVLLLSWEDIEKGIDIIGEKILKSGYRPDVIISVLRGGVIPGRLLADRLGIDDIGSMEIKLYIAAGQKGERPYMRQPVTLPIKDKKVLLVDDVSDSGLTLEFAIQAISLYMPMEIKTATLYMKPWTRLVPDFYAEEVDKWVVFPWEKKEFEKEYKSMTKVWQASPLLGISKFLNLKIY